MNCPAWPDLVARRDRGDSGAESAWDRALAHADGCADCAEEARAAEPLLLFRALAGSDERDAGADAAASPAEILEMKAAVATLRRASAADSHALRPVASRLGIPVSPAGRRAVSGVAAALLLAASLVLLPGAGPVAVSEAPPVAPAVAVAVARVSTLASEAGRSAALLDGPPRPGARIYELRQEDLAVVMIVDESLDV